MAVIQVRVVNWYLILMHQQFFWTDEITDATVIAYERYRKTRLWYCNLRYVFWGVI